MEEAWKAVSLLSGLILFTFLFWTRFAFTSPHVLVVAAEHLQHGCTLSLRLGSDCDPTLLRLLQRSYGCSH
jgi:hypothetical protein